MKKIITLGAVALMSALSVMAKDANQFTVSGDIPGIKDGAVVKLTARGSRNGAIAETVAKDGRFVLEGSVDAPSLCRLTIAKEGGRKGDAGFDMLVDNSPISISVVHVDSLPPSNYVGTRGRLRQKNVKISGGRAQDEYNTYNEYMLPYELEQLAAHYKCYWSSDVREISKEEKEQREKSFLKAVGSNTEARRRFITEHPKFTISAILLVDELKEPFSFTNAELDGLMEMVKGCPDKESVNQVVSAIDGARKVVKGADYADFGMVAPDGSKHKFSEIAGHGKYVFLDFWASWCGPCRAAIPHVRELNKNYADKVEVVSVSIDDEADDWKKALDEEKMEWKQFHSPEELRDEVKNGYRCRSIPYMVVISPEGKIVYAGHNAADAEAALAGK